MTLTVKNLSKIYRRGNATLADVVDWFLPLRRAGSKKVPPSLDSVSFSLEPGRCLGLIGPNGAGKSTLLKVLTGRVKPTSGKIDIPETVNAIIELGVGFNHDLTGRENVENTSQLFGVSPSEVDECHQYCREFSEIGDFYEQSLRVYSSGMVARLAFSVATFKQPDLLILDEVLSVGDSYFQHKSFSRIKNLKNLGTSIIYVSHGLEEIKRIADEVIYLDGGRVRHQGRPVDVIDFYNASISAKTKDITVDETVTNWPVTRSGTLEATVSDIEIVDAVSGESLSAVRSGQRIRVNINIIANADIEKLVTGIKIRDRAGIEIFGTNTHYTADDILHIKAGEKITVSFMFNCCLGYGSYSISPALVSGADHLENNYEWVDNYHVFDVVNLDYPFFVGLVSLNPEVFIER